MSSIMHSSLCQENGLKNSTEIAESNSSYPGSGSDVAVAVSIGTFLSLAIVVGNGLIIVSVAVVKKLRQPANYLIVSLALSDFLVGFIVLPLTIVNDSGNEWIFGSMMCDVHVSFDVICCTASIMNLCMISIDRYLMITKPMTYPKKRTGKLMVMMIAIAWMISCLIILPALFGFTENVKDGPDWLNRLRSVNNGSTSPKQQMSTISSIKQYQYDIYNHTRNLRKAQDSNHHYQHAAFDVFDLGQPFQIIKYNCRTLHSNSQQLVKVLLQAEICDKDETNQNNETILVSLNDLWDEVCVVSDVRGRFIKISVNISEEFYQQGGFGCKVYGEKLRGKTCLISQEVWFTIYSTVGAFYLPLTVMLVMYWKIYNEASKFQTGGKRQSAAYSQDVSESPSRNDLQSLNEYKSTSTPSAERKFIINLADENISNKLPNSDSDGGFFDYPDGFLLECSQNGDDKANYAFKNPTHDLILNKSHKVKVADFYIGRKTDLGSQLSCCSESFIAKNDDRAISLPSLQDKKENLHSAHQRISSCQQRKMSVESFTPPNEISKNEKTGCGLIKRTLSANDICCKPSATNNPSLVSPATKYTRLTNGVAKEESKFPPISENNVFDFHSEQQNKAKSFSRPSANKITNLKTKEIILLNRKTSTSGGSHIYRAYQAGPRCSIFSGSSSHEAARHLYRRHSSLSNRNFSNGAASLYAKRRQSVGARRASLSSRCSQTGSEIVSKHTSKRCNAWGNSARLQRWKWRISVCVINVKATGVKLTNLGDRTQSFAPEGKQSSKNRKCCCCSTNSLINKKKWNKVFSHIKRRVSVATARERMRNVKATRTLGIIVGVFTFCWLPFFIVTFLRPFICEHPEAQDCIPIVLVRVVLWLGYVNSALNPLIYIGFSADLRKSFCYLLSCKCTNVDRRLAQNEFRRAISRERQDSFTSHQAAAESIM